MAVVVTIVVSDNQLVSQPVEDVTVWFYTDAEVLLTSTLTDADGEIELMLDGSTDPGTQYIVRLRKDGYSFTEGPTQKIYVLDPLPGDDSNVFDIEAHAHVLPESNDANMCMLSGYLSDTAGRAIASRPVKFVARKGFPDDALGGMHFTGDPSVIGRRIVVADATFETDETGYLECSLPRGGRLDVHIYGAEHPSGVTSPILIPDAAGWRLEDVLFIYPVSVTYDSASVSVSVGETETLDVEALLSNGATIEEEHDMNRRLVFSSSDTDVFDVILSGDGELTISGNGVGTATLLVERADGTAVPARPEIGDLEVTNPTVTVG